MSSHREAPEISKDPVADSDGPLCLRQSRPARPSDADRQLHPPPGARRGPNFYEFGDDVLYEIHIDNNGDALADITYQFRFTSEITNPNTFLYNTGPIQHLGDPNWNRRQTYSVTLRRPRPGSATAGLGRPLPPLQHRAPVHPELRAARRRGRHRDRSAAPPSSPGSGPRASTSTSAPSSTSATCVPSSRTTPPSAWRAPASGTWPPGSTRPPGSTSTASPSRCRSSSSPPMDAGRKA